MSWSDKATGLGKKSKPSKKEIHEVRTRKGASGGFIHEHHHKNPEAHPMEEHTSPDQASMLQHMAQSMGDGGQASPAAAAPDPSAAAGAAPPTGAPSPVPGM
jgi:hypothetical protein